jgi:hypothetical protein
MEAEVIVGTVHSSTTDHIRGEPIRPLLNDAANKRLFETVSLGFFSDIYIPKHALPPNTFLYVRSKNAPALELTSILVLSRILAIMRTTPFS